MTEQNKQLKTLFDFCSESLTADELPNADAIFLFASHEAERAQEAARLFNLGKAPIVIVTGGFNHFPELLPKECKTESEYLASVLVAEGVPQEAVIVETRPQNLLENVLYGMQNLRERGLQINSLILFSWPPLIKRAEATFRKNFPEVTLYTYGFKTEFREDMTPVEVSRVLGEIDRYRAYSAKGDISPIEIPPEVQQAYDFLRTSAVR